MYELRWLEKPADKVVIPGNREWYAYQGETGWESGIEFCPQWRKEKYTLSVHGKEVSYHKTLDEAQDHAQQRYQLYMSALHMSDRQWVTNLITRVQALKRIGNDWAIAGLRDRFEPEPEMITVLEIVADAIEVSIGSRGSLPQVIHQNPDGSEVVKMPSGETETLQTS